MTSPVYSVRLAEVLGPPPFVPYDLGTPDVGYKWILKDIVVGGTGGLAASRLGFRVFDSGNCDIFSVFAPFTVSGVSYHWAGSQVIEFGEHLWFTPNDPGWSIRVCGYTLTLP